MLLIYALFFFLFDRLLVSDSFVISTAFWTLLKHETLFFCGGIISRQIAGMRIYTTNNILGILCRKLQVVPILIERPLDELLSHSQPAAMRAHYGYLWDEGLSRKGGFSPDIDFSHVSFCSSAHWLIRAIIVADYISNGRRLGQVNEWDHIFFPFIIFGEVSHKSEQVLNVLYQRPYYVHCIFHWGMSLSIIINNNKALLAQQSTISRIKHIKTHFKKYNKSTHTQLYLNTFPLIIRVTILTYRESWLLYMTFKNNYISHQLNWDYTTQWFLSV